jgi:hypothetical protein
MIIRAGEVAADGIIKTIGVINKEARKQILVTTTVKPVLPPASTPAEDSKYVVIHGMQKKLPATVEIESTLKTLSIPGKFPCSSKNPALPPTPKAVPNVEKKSGIKRAIRKGIYAKFRAPLKSIFIKYFSGLSGKTKKELGILVIPIGIPIIVVARIAIIIYPGTFMFFSNNIIKNPIIANITVGLAKSPKAR